MAKKIKISNQTINQIIMDNNTEKKDKIKKFSVILNVILIIFIFLIGFGYNEIKEEFNLSKVNCAYQTYNDCKYEYQTEVEKSNFLDNNIVFVVKEYGNYYYDYDCLINLSANKNVTYLAYNKENAIAKGYIKGKC